VLHTRVSLKGPVNSIVCVLLGSFVHRVAVWIWVFLNDFVQTVWFS